MAHDNERFEEYLRGFDAPEAWPGLARLAFERAHRRRRIRKTIFTCIGAFGAALFVTVFSLRTPEKETKPVKLPSSGLIIAKAETKFPDIQSVNFQYRTLKGIYRQGGLDALNSHFDREEQKHLGSVLENNGSFFAGTARSIRSIGLLD